MRRLSGLLIAGALAVQSPAAEPPPGLPSGTAGAIVSRAIATAGGWARWRGLRAVSYLSSTEYFHPLAGGVKESLGRYELLLHSWPRIRFSSVDLREHVAVVLAHDEVWLEREGIPVCDPPRLNLARLHLAGNEFLLSLPFSLAETWLGVRDVGDATDGTRRWHQLRVLLEADAFSPEGADYFVVGIDAQSGLTDRIYGRFRAPFLAHSLWVVLLSDYRDVAGIKIAHRREVFPADAEGHVVGPRQLAQVVEDVRFDDGTSPALFRRPIPQPCTP
jgi:hypothetical protein